MSAGELRDMREVTGLEAFGLTEPTWLTCPCGAQTARVPCWDCTLAATARTELAERRREAEVTIPREFAWATLASPDLPKRVDSRRKALDEVARRVLAAHRVVLAGGAGTGKTSLAVACLRERLPGARFVSAIRLGTARIQHAAGDGEAAIVELAMTAKLLLIDDVGQEAMTATSALKDVIWARHDASLPTWITTGLRSSDLVGRYGDGFRRRVLENAFVERLGPVEPAKLRAAP